MASERAIVGIGEVLLHRAPAGDRVGGLAAETALAAARLGRRAVVVSRIGQDEPGARILDELRGAGVDVEHLQSDPDLPTGRLNERTIAGRTTITLEPRSAFDNLQWDYDLEDIAQETEAYLFGNLARRNSQTRTTIDRYLSLCGHALGVFNMTNQPQGPPDRVAMARALEFAGGVIASRDLLHTMAPGGGAEADDVIASSLERKYQLAFIVLIGTDGRLRSFAGGTTASHEQPIDHRFIPAATVGLLHGLLCGWDWPKALASAVRYARFAADHPNEDAPATLFDAT